MPVRTPGEADGNTTLRTTSHLVAPRANAAWRYVSGTALMARTLHELSTFKVRSISKNLMFKEGEAANSALPTAQNNLGAKVVFAIFRDANDNFYFVSFRTTVGNM